jgi:hypothetical protein
MIEEFAGIGNYAPKPPGYVPKPVPAPPPEPVVTKKIVLPCIATTLGKNGETMYLLDNSRNLVFCDEKGLFSLDSDYILNTFANRKKPEVKLDRYNRNSYTNNCIKKQIELNGTKYLQEKPNGDNVQKFILNEVKINGDILNKYNLTDISLNEFQGSRIYRDNLSSSPQPAQYQQLDNNQKKRFACGLYYYFITEVLTFPESLNNYLKEEAVKPGYNENNSVAKFYSDSGRSIDKWQINVLDGFQKDLKIFTYVSPVVNKGPDVGLIVGIIVGVILFFAIIGGYLLYRRRNPSTTTSSSASSASGSTTSAAAPAKAGHPPHPVGTKYGTG